MSREKVRPLIITGIHRSGTTWLGKLLEMSEDTHVYYEPFNPIEKYYPVRVKFVRHWFHYLSDEDFKKHKDEIEYGLQLHYSGSVIRKQIGYLRSLPHLAMLLAHLKSYYVNRVYHNRRPVIKDPMLVFSVEQLIKYYALDILITIRHPAAFVASVKRMHEQQNWGISFQDWIFDQPGFPDEIYREYQVEMERTEAQNAGVVEKAALFWKIVYSYLAHLPELENDINFVRHEDISIQPVEEIRKIYVRYGLDFSESIKDKIITMTGSDNPTEAEAGAAHTFYRNSLSNVKSWKKKLSEKEQQLIYDITKDTSKVYYQDAEW